MNIGGLPAAVAGNDHAVRRRGRADEVACKGCGAGRSPQVERRREKGWRQRGEAAPAADGSAGPDAAPGPHGPAIIRATLGSARLELGERCKYAVVIIVSSPLGHVPADRDFSSLVGDLNTATAWPRRHLALLRVESGLGHALLSWVVALFNLPIIARNRSFGQMLLSAALRQRITQ